MYLDRSRWPLLHGHIVVAGDLEEDEQRNDGGCGKDGGQGRRGAVAGADDLVVDGHRHGPGVGRVQHHRGGQLVDEGDPAEDGAGGHAGEHHLGGHLQKGHGLGIPQADGSLLHAGADLVKDGRAGAQGVGLAADHQGDHDDGGAAGQHDGGMVKGHQQGDTQNRAGDDVGEHGDGIDEVGQPVLPAHRQVGDEHPQHHDDDDGDQAVQVGVFDGLDGGGKDLAVAFQRVAVHKDLHLGSPEGGVNHHALGDDGHPGQQVDVQVDQQALDPVGLLGLNRPQGTHGEGFGVDIPLLEEEDGRRNHHHDGGHGGGEVGRAAGFAHELGIDQGGHDPVALADEGRGAEVGHAVHKDQQRRGNQGGGHQGHDDGKDLPHRAAPQALRSLGKGHVDLFQGAGNVHIDEGIQLEGKDQEHPPEAVDGGHIDAEALQELGHRAAAPQEQDPGIGADEVGAHHGNDKEDLQKAPAADLVEGHKVGQGDAQKHRHDGDADGQLKGIEQRGGVVFPGEKAQVVCQGPDLCFGILKAAQEQAEQGIDQEQREQHQRPRRDDGPEIPCDLTFRHIVSHPVSSCVPCPG